MEFHKDICEEREANKINTITMDKFPLRATHLSVNSNTAIKTYNHQQHNTPALSVLYYRHPHRLAQIEIGTPPKFYAALRHKMCPRGMNTYTLKRIKWTLIVGNSFIELLCSEPLCSSTWGHMLRLSIMARSWRWAKRNRNILYT